MDLYYKKERILGEKDLEKKPNLNLLINNYFANPVNRNGEITKIGVSNGYWLDGWVLDANLNGEIKDDFIKITKTSATNNPGFRQVLNGFDDIVGKTVTFSCLYRTNSSGIRYNGGGSNATMYFSPSTDWNLFTQTYTLIKSSFGSWVLNVNCIIQFSVNMKIDDYVDIKAIKLELGDTQTLAHQDENGNWVLNEIPSYAEQYAICSQYSPITGDFIGSQNSNPNLLINSYLADPINQKEIGSIMPSEYGLDGWALIGNSSGTFERYSGVRLTTPNGWFRQKTELDIKNIGGKTVTISILTIDNELYSNTGIVPLTGRIDIALGEMTVRLQVDPTGLGVYIRHATKEFSIQAVKLELGPIQTLAHKEGDQWVLNDPPLNKALELLKCQRYLVVYRYPDANVTNTTWIAVGMAYNATTVRFFLDLPTSMAVAKPTITNNGFKVFSKQSHYDISEILVLWNAVDNKLGIQATCPNAQFAVGDLCFLESYNNTSLTVDGNL